MPIYQLVLPAMGESVSEATVTQWLKKEGDTVVADEAVVEVATDKVDSEVASEYNGVIKEILHPVNAVVAVDAPLALIETDEKISEETLNETTALIETPVSEETVNETPESYMQQAQELVAPAVTLSTTEDSRFYSPLVKNIAKQENISEYHKLRFDLMEAMWLDLVSIIKISAHFQKIKYIKNQSYQNMVMIKVNCPFLYSSMKKKS